MQQQKEAKVPLLASSFDQSKYLRAEDLTQEKLLRIESVSVELVGRGPNQEQKPVLWFTNHVKGLPLNKTNNRTIRGAYGDDMETWVGKLIVLFPTQTPFEGKMVGALRVRIPTPKQTKKSAAAPPPQEAAKPAAETKPAPAEAPPEADLDLDDEIPL
jgi:hypothetical protein